MWQWVTASNIDQIVHFNQADSTVQKVIIGNYYTVKFLHPLIRSIRIPPNETMWQFYWISKLSQFVLWGSTGNLPLIHQFSIIQTAPWTSSTELADHVLLVSKMNMIRLY